MHHYKFYLLVAGEVYRVGQARTIKISVTAELGPTFNTMASPCWICRYHSSTGTEFPLSTSVFPLSLPFHHCFIFIHTHSFIYHQPYIEGLLEKPTKYIDVFLTMHHSIELFHIPTLMHNYLFINTMYVTLQSSTCFEH